jgi:hypothetical protein
MDMPVEEVVAGGLIRLIVWFFSDIIVGTICWGIGWGVLKILTLGSYPKLDTKNSHVIAVGLVAIIIVSTAVIIYVS